jgi:hypothetical protein
VRWVRASLLAYFSTVFCLAAAWAGPLGEGEAAPQTRQAAMLDRGGYYKFRDPGFQLLLFYGHTVFGKSKTYAYLGV